MERESYFSEKETLLRKWEGELEKLSAKKDVVKAESKIQVNQRLLDLQTLVKQLHGDLASLKDATGDKFEKAKGAFELKIADTSNKINDHVQKLR